MSPCPLRAPSPAVQIPDDIRPVWAVVAGRMGSERLAGKTMADLAGVPSLRRNIERLKQVPALDGICVATTDQVLDDVIRACARDAGVESYSGSTHDVLARTLNAAQSVNARTIVQVTGDCPLTDPAIVQRAIEAYAEERPDYATTVQGGGGYPDGYNVEVFATDLLAEVEAATRDPDDREHVSLYIYNHPERYRVLGLQPPAHIEFTPGLHLSLDTIHDLEAMRAIHAALLPRGPYFGIEDVLEFLREHPEVEELTQRPRDH